MHDASGGEAPGPANIRVHDTDLECRQVSRHFGRITAVDDVSFAIPRGSFFSILGPSGCGKTTLMRMIAGFESPDSGDILIRGHSVLDVPPNRRNAKMVFQHLALFPMMNVYENIAYGLRCRGEAAAAIARKVADVLERVALPEVAERAIHQLSGGQKQRIAIARCMVLEPDVLLLDEPLGALDLKLREAMKIELKQLQHRFGTTFVYITHDQSEALVMSERIAVMNAGRFEQIGTPQALYREPESAFVAGFVGDGNRFGGRVARVDSSVVVIDCDAGFTAFARASSSGNLRAGTPATVFVRPEYIRATRIDRLHEEPGDDQKNRVRGHIESVLFNGANSRVLVRLDGDAGRDDDSLVEADVVLGGGDGDPAVDEHVMLEWASEQARCFATPAAT